jgi:hypothetical protein
VFDTVNEEKSEMYNVCVPVTVEKEVSVQVCTMVAKKVMVAVPASNAGAYGAGNGNGAGGCGAANGGCGACGAAAPAAPCCN